MRGADGTLLQRLLGMRCVRALVVAGSFEQRLRDGQDRHIRDTGYRIDMASRRLDWRMVGLTF